VQEYEISASGAMGEAAGPGSLLNFAAKSGTDAFHWSALANYQNDSMRSDNVPDALSTPGGKDENGFFAPPAGIGDSNAIVSMYDANGDLGGPLVRGKARFYVSFRDNNYYTTVAGLPGVEIQSRLSNATAKVNYSLNARNTLIGFYTWRYKLDSDRGISAAVPHESARNQVGLMHLGKVEWTSMLSDRLFLDLQVGVHKASNEYTSPLNKSRDTTGLPVGRNDLVTGQSSGTANNLAYNPDIRPQFTGSLSWSPGGKLWGSHFVKVGFQIHKFNSSGESWVVEDVYYYDRNGVPAEVSIYNTPGTSTNTNQNIGIYAQDAWNVGKRVTLNIGARYDNYKLVGRYTTPFWGISAATTYRLMSGYNWVRTLSVKFPVAGSVTIPASEVSLNRAPKVSIVDVRLDKSLNIGSGKMMFVVDLSNLLNAGTVTNFRTGSGSRFKEIIALLPGRSVRVGVEVRF